MSEGRPVTNLTQHESIYGTILIEPEQLLAANNDA